MKTAKKLSLEPFFTVKTHKEGSPFRTIVQDRGTWQRKVALFLQTHLDTLPTNDPFLICGSEELVDYFNNCKPVTATSVDVIDLFYNIPHQAALKAVELSIDFFGPVKFQNQCGVSCSNLLELLRIYLESLYMAYEDGVFVQKTGISIGSCVAPVLSDLCLGQGNRKLEEELADVGVVQCFQFVGNFLLFPG